MRRSIATVCLAARSRTSSRRRPGAGLRRVELFENDLIKPPLSKAEVRGAADALGLTIELYQPFRDFEAVPRVFLRPAPSS